ncbi:hypothetical protein [Streptomyces sp. MJM1172]|uniref:hypothetical protein n=1 Tax=Streptomyces sp. MJM1172 TaxID=1703926 RepID=UPI00093F9844|nr:hypothetical protein [Streptomyces sp. MJM1172]OKI47484.1 hypothetical protein AMK15_35305 [Streptomyces sp. MJM1172]
MGYARRDERRRTGQQFHTELVDLIEQNAPTTLAARLRTAGLHPGRPLLALTALTRKALCPWDLAAELAESAPDEDPDSTTAVADGEHGLTILVSLVRRQTMRCSPWTIAGPARGTRWPDRRHPR